MAGVKIYPASHGQARTPDLLSRRYLLGLLGAFVEPAFGADQLDGLEAGLFDGLAALVSVDAHVNVDGEMERVPAVSATDDALWLLGAAPLALGRPLDVRQDSGETYIHSVVISHDLWQRRLGGDPAVIGRHIDVNNLDVEVVGVLGANFRVFLPPSANLPESVDVWFPRGFDPDRRWRGQISLAKLAPSVSLESVQNRLEVLSARFVADHAADYKSMGLGNIAPVRGVAEDRASRDADRALRLVVRPLHDTLTAGVKPALWVLAGAVGFVLLIGCVNIANLMTARARARAQEMAVRRALGAAQGRLTLQLFTEAAVLSVLGTVCGFALAYGGVAVIEWLRPAHLPRQSTVMVTTDVAWFTALLAVMVSVVFGLLPARAHKASAHEALRVGRVSVQRAGIRRLQRMMVMAEVALSMVPLVAAGLMLRTFINLTNVELGFDTRSILTAKIGMRFRSFPEPADRWG